MAELHDMFIRPERSFLVGIQNDKILKEEAESLLDELGALAVSLGLEDVGRALVRVRESNAALFIGSGKADEIVAAAKAAEADSILFDHQLSPAQQRNWEKLSDLKAYDRNELIIRIFASGPIRKRGRAPGRARPARVFAAASRPLLRRPCPGSAAAATAPRARASRRSSSTAARSSSASTRSRKSSRTCACPATSSARGARRPRCPGRPSWATRTPASRASSTPSRAPSVLVEDKLFATLDPTTRRMSFKKGEGSLLLTDTVGFVRNLPHGLVEAFKATLEEAARAELLVEVVDASDPEAEKHMETTEQVLREIGAGEVPRVLVLNKIDLVRNEPFLEAWRSRHPEAVLTSAKTGEGLDELLSLIENRLTESDPAIELRVPDGEYAFVALLHREATILEERHDGEATLLRCRVPARLGSRFERFRV